ncbi:MAG: hypothetical protein U1F09_16680 [Steroidobacteraceae bacterium]
MIGTDLCARLARRDNDERQVERAEILREKGTDRSRFFRGEVDRYGWVDLGSSYPQGRPCRGLFFEVADRGGLRSSSAVRTSGSATTPRSQVAGGRTRRASRSFLHCSPRAGVPHVLYLLLLSSRCAAFGT